MYFVKKNNKHQCTLCPRLCILGHKDIGFCGSRVGEIDGIKYSGYGKISSIFIEPIEKKPFYHYHLGEKTLSIGFYGCNLSCKYCQNWKISQKNDNNYKYYSTDSILSISKEKKCKIICFTYSEPSLHMEYIKDISFLAKKENIKVILKTNAFLNNNAWKNLINYVDAVNIDFKGSSSKDIIGINFDTTLNILECIKRNKHLEISIPIINEIKIDEYKKICNILSSNYDIPIHLIKIYPSFKYELETEDKLIDYVKNIFKEFKYIYEYRNQNTICKKCGLINIKRVGYNIIKKTFSNKCAECLKLEEGFKK